MRLTHWQLHYLICRNFSIHLESHHVFLQISNKKSYKKGDKMVNSEKKCMEVALMTRFYDMFSPIQSFLIMFKNLLQSNLRSLTVLYFNDIY